MSADKREVTQLLSAWRSGDPRALDRLMPVVYDELHGLARAIFRGERPDHTLQATALVHEAFLRLVEADVSMQDRAHFFALAARQMRFVLINHALAKKSAKRGGGVPAVSLDEALAVVGAPSAEITDLDDALTRLEKFDERKARVLEMHFFGGLTYQEMAEALHVSAATIDADLRFAKAWLKQQLDGEPPAP